MESVRNNSSYSLSGKRESRVKAYLKQAGVLTAEIAAIQKQLDSISDHAFSLPSVSALSNTRVQASVSKEASYARLLEEKFQMEYTLKKRCDELMNRRNEIINTINQYTNGMENLVLTSRYICGDKWSKIEENLGYSIRQLSRFEKSGFEKIRLPDEATGFPCAG